jgi:predicted NBD/HSP70 family sugar kinase
VGDPALEAAFEQINGTSITTTDAARAARDGSEAHGAIFARAGPEPGRAIANLVNVLNPELIVLSGEGSHAADLIVPALTDALEAHTFNGLIDDINLVVEPWDDEAWARGAASLVLAEMFQPALRPHDGVERPTLATSVPLPT